MTNLITEAREMYELRRKQKHIPMTMLDKTLELCDALEKAAEWRTAKTAVPHKADEDVEIGNALFRKGVTIWHCPTCGIFLTPAHKYCWECGQALSFAPPEKEGE